MQLRNTAKFFLICLIYCSISHAGVPTNGNIVLQTDFTLKDGAVAAMKGVIYSVSPSLKVTDLTHEITAYNIREASYRLYQVAPYWPKGTVFVSVVDPGVGTKRRSIVAESKNGYYFVTPDNGTLTLINDQFGLQEVRQIDETKHRLKGSNGSYTFHGRDVYSYTAAKLASGTIVFNEVGPKINGGIVKLAYDQAYKKNNTLYGAIVVQDADYGNLWTNINANLLKEFPLVVGKVYNVIIYCGKVKKYSGKISYQNTFGDVPKGSSLIYLNSLMNLSIGINQGDFAREYHINPSQNCRVEIDLGAKV